MTRCNAPLCHEPAEYHPGITQKDGTELPWDLCAKHYAAYLLDLADIEARNAAEDARAEGIWRATHHG